MFVDLFFVVVSAVNIELLVRCIFFFFWQKGAYEMRIRDWSSDVCSSDLPDSGLLAIESARRCVSPRTRAIVLVHLYGQVRDMDGWKDLCREHAIELIEDCAQSHLSCWDGVTAGAFGTAGTYS